MTFEFFQRLSEYIYINITCSIMLWMKRSLVHDVQLAGWMMMTTNTYETKYPNHDFKLKLNKVWGDRLFKKKHSPLAWVLAVNLFHTDIRGRFVWNSFFLQIQETLHMSLQALQLCPWASVWWGALYAYEEVQVLLVLKTHELLKKKYTPIQYNSITIS